MVCNIHGLEIQFNQILVWALNCSTSITCVLLNCIYQNLFCYFNPEMRWKTLIRSFTAWYCRKKEPKSKTRNEHSVLWNVALQYRRLEKTNYKTVIQKINEMDSVWSAYAIILYIWYLLECVCIYWEESPPSSHTLPVMAVVNHHNTPNYISMSIIYNFVITRLYTKFIQMSHFSLSNAILTWQTP